MKYMPSCPRHVSRFGLYACLLSAVSLAGCSRTIPTLLAAGPDLEFAGKVESGGAGLPVRCKSGKPLETYAWVARLTQHDFDARLELRTQDGAILESIASPARGGGHEYLYREPLRGEVASLHVIAAQEPVASSATYRVEVFCLRQAPSAEVASAWRSLMRDLFSRISGSGKWFNSSWRKSSLEFSTTLPSRSAAPSQIREESGVPTSSM